MFSHSAEQKVVCKKFWTYLGEDCKNIIFKVSAPRSISTINLNVSIVLLTTYRATNILKVLEFLYHFQFMSWFAPVCTALLLLRNLLEIADLRYLQMLCLHFGVAQEHSEKIINLYSFESKL